MEKIASDLKGADFNKKLVWKTNEGFDVMPFYRTEDTENLLYTDTLPGQFPYLRGTKTKNNSWLVRQNIEVTDYSQANSRALSVLMKGIDSPGFIITDPESVNRENFEILLREIHPEAIELNFQCNGKAREIIDILKELLVSGGLDQGVLRGAFEADPLSKLMVNGTLCIPPEDGFDYLAGVVASAQILPHFRVIHINASDFRNAGTGITEELGFALSMATEYMEQLTQRGISIETAASKIRFSFGIGPDYFPEIAKIRAARLLWSVVMNDYLPGNSESSRMDIHSVTSRWNKTLYDPYVNLLRTQTEAMSAILGGTDSLTVEPFDIVFRQPDEFSERIARNQQLILKEEAYFEKVADPGAGSYYIENLTKLISERSWKLFLELEDNGGFLKSLRSGLVQQKIIASAETRKQDIATRKTILLGTNQFPNIKEKASEDIDIDKLFNNTQDKSEQIVAPVSPIRASREYEKLRIAVDKADKRPVVFILQAGNPVMRKARAQFTSSFFGCAGYELIESDGFESVEDAIMAAAEARPDIIVICSSDEEYPLYAPRIYQALYKKAIIVVAGRPAGIDELKAEGIEYFIHARSNVIEVLTEFNRRLGIK